MLGGTIKPVLLSKKLIVAKSLGLLFSVSGGLVVGKEGPFVHISTSLCDQLLRFPCLQNLRRQDSKRLELLSCACAVGVAGTFFLMIFIIFY